MLKSQTVWFMAVGRDRDQRRCQLLSRQPIPPLAPLPSLPGTQHRARPPGPSRRMRGILSAHLLTALHVLTPTGCKECRRPWGCDHLAPQWVSARVGERRQWAEDQGNLADGKRRTSGMAHRWESESSWTELLSFGQHNKDQIIYFCHGPCWMKSKPPRSWSKVLACCLSWRATNKYDSQEWSRRIGGRLWFTQTSFLKSHFTFTLVWASERKWLKTVGKELLIMFIMN